MIAALLASSDAESGAVDELTRKVCFTVHGSDAQAIRKFEQEGLFRVLGELKDDVEKKLEIAEQKSKDYDAQLSKVEKCMREVAELENIQRYNGILRIGAKRIADIGLLIKKKEMEYEDETDSNKKKDLRGEIENLEPALESVTSNLEEALPSRYHEEITARFGNIGPWSEDEDLDMYWPEIYAGTFEIEHAIQAALPKANSALMQAREDAVPVLESYVEALEELSESNGMLSVMEQVVSETEACRADARKIAPRRDFVANFKVDCRSPEYDAPVCGHGTMWINFDAQGRPTGQAGFSRICATSGDERECLEVPTAQVTGVTGQIAVNRLTAIVTYLLPSNRPRKDTGNFRFEGQVTPDGGVMPIAWRGAGSLTTIENKYPPFEKTPYAVTCIGQWATDSEPVCWNE